MKDGLYKVKVILNGECGFLSYNIEEHKCGISSDLNRGLIFDNDEFLNTFISSNLDSNNQITVIEKICVADKNKSYVFMNADDNMYLYGTRPWNISEVATKKSATRFSGRKPYIRKLYNNLIRDYKYSIKVIEI